MGRKVVTVYFNFQNKGGAQNIALNLAEKLSEKESLPVIFTNTPKELIHSDYKERANFLPFSVTNIIRFFRDDYAFLSHDRKSTTKLMLVNMLFGSKLKILHVSHNVFNSLSSLTLFPKNIISISTAVTKNLKEYFKISPDRIRYIPNGLPDLGLHSPRNCQSIKILMAGRICRVKRQIEIANAFKKAYLPNISIAFAGIGEDAPALKNLIKGSDNITYLGEINIAERIGEFDYVLLFSEKEGLPLILIEACMSGKPMLTNNLPSVTDINVNNKTGFVYESLDDLIAALQTLPNSTDAQYIQLSENSRRQYELFFTEDQMVESYRQAIDSLY